MTPPTPSTSFAASMASAPTADNWGKQGPELLEHRLSQHLTRETMRPAGRQPVAGEVIMTHISTTSAAVGTQ